MTGMTWVRMLVGAVWLNGALEKLLNPEFPRQFATDLGAGGFIAQAPPWFQHFMQSAVVPNADLFRPTPELRGVGAGARVRPPHQPGGGREHPLGHQDPLISRRRPARYGGGITRISNYKPLCRPDLGHHTAEPCSKSALLRFRSSEEPTASSPTTDESPGTRPQGLRSSSPL